MSRRTFRRIPAIERSPLKSRVHSPAAGRGGTGQSSRTRTRSAAPRIGAGELVDLDRPRRRHAGPRPARPATGQVEDRGDPGEDEHGVAAPGQPAVRRGQPGDVEPHRHEVGGLDAGPDEVVAPAQADQRDERAAARGWPAAAAPCRSPARSPASPGRPRRPSGRRPGLSASTAPATSAATQPRTARVVTRPPGSGVPEAAPAPSTASRSSRPRTTRRGRPPARRRPSSSHGRVTTSTGREGRHRERRERPQPPRAQREQPDRQQQDQGVAAGRRPPDRAAPRRAGTCRRLQASSATEASATPSRSVETRASRTSSGLSATCAAFHGVRRTDAAVTQHEHRHEQRR